MINTYKPTVAIQFSCLLVEEMTKEFREYYKHPPTVCFVGWKLYGSEYWARINQWSMETISIPIVLDWYLAKVIYLSDGLNQLTYDNPEY